MRKSIRLSSVGLAPAPDPVRNFSTRFSLSSYAKRVQQLTPEQRSAITRTGFGNLLSVPNHTLNKVFLTEVIDTWSCELRAFVLRAGCEIRMTPLDVALILGLPVAGYPVVLTEKEPLSDLEELYGATKRKRNLAMNFLESRLDSIGEVASDDFVRSFLMYTIGTFLASNDGKKVDSRYLCFLENLGEVSGFAWGSAVVDDLCQWLDKRKEHNVQYVGGCLIFLQTWCYEHFDMARPHLQDHDLTFPRVCRWDNSKSNQRQRGTSRFKDLHDEKIIWKLQPTSEELQIKIIKEALELLGDNIELHSAESCSTSTSTNVLDVDSELQLSISNKAPIEDEDAFENQIVEDTPTRSCACDEEYTEQEVDLKNLIVSDTPPDFTICEEIRRERLNVENLVVLDTPPDSGGHSPRFHQVVEDTPINLSIADEVGREQESNEEILVVDDTPSPSKLSSYDDDLRNKIVILEVVNAELKLKLDQAMEENELLRKQIMSNSQLEESNAEMKKELELLREENKVLRGSISGFLDRMDEQVLDLETNVIE